MQQQRAVVCGMASLAVVRRSHQPPKRYFITLTHYIDASDRCLFWVHSCWVSPVLHSIEFFTLMDGRFAEATAKEDRSFVTSASAGVIRFNPLAVAIKRGK